MAGIYLRHEVSSSWLVWGSLQQGLIEIYMESGAFVMFVLYILISALLAGLGIPLLMA